ncbi:hypothetical protein CYMTET_20352 [Cymbomonas tetramitiformis]|uniref:Uncharacterized protein n=1 Tax=Cymbomonas tetramitiformis TaxID=36881 RepID=A0AAE0G483_9CHLO|nr:hypothetical protein CYMTET_20352 [Cymbomonas tetramitiformis]
MGTAAAFELGIERTAGREVLPPRMGIVRHLVHSPMSLRQRQEMKMVTPSAGCVVATPSTHPVLSASEQVTWFEMGQRPHATVLPLRQARVVVAIHENRLPFCRRWKWERVSVTPLAPRVAAT